MTTILLLQAYVCLCALVYEQNHSNFWRTKRKISEMPSRSPSGCLPLSLSHPARRLNPATPSTAARKCHSRREVIEDLCKQIADAHVLERELLARVQRSLSPDGEVTPPHRMPSADSFTTLLHGDHPSPAPLKPAAGYSPDVVDGRKVWSRRHSSQPSASSEVGPLQRLQEQNDSYLVRIALLEKENFELRQQLQQHHAKGARVSRGAQPQRTPGRSITDVSNVLLHDSTHRLLAEAEDALLGETYNSTFLQ